LGCEDFVIRLTVLDGCIENPGLIKGVIGTVERDRRSGAAGAKSAKHLSGMGHGKVRNTNIPGVKGEEIERVAAQPK
jgi:hypothetical protein